jgi:hypothetical protein
MSPLEYLKWLYTERAYTKKVVIMSILLARFDEPIKNPLKGQVGFSNGQYEFWDESKWVELSMMAKPVDNIIPAFLSYSMPIKLPANSFPNVHKDIDTQVGNVIVNILCLLHPFGNRIPFIEGQYNADKIETFINEQFVDVGKDGITQPMIEQYVTAVRMLMSMAGLVTTAATRKNTVPPPGIEGFKRKLSKELDLTKSLDQTKFTAALLKYDDEWLKDDPSRGILLSGKVKNKARLKLYMSFANETTFGPVGTMTSYHTESLNGGIKTDKHSFGELFSSARAASYSRGKLTAIGGVLAKLLARIVADVTIVDNDCGTPHHLPYYIDKTSKQMVGRYARIGNKDVLLTKELFAQNTNKVLQFRSPGKCISPDNSFCRICAGEMMWTQRESVRLASQELGGGVLSLYLSLFHGISRDAVRLPFDQIAV